MNIVYKTAIRSFLCVGQAGRGNSEEFGLLSLEFDENFCMGGPGVIMSRETLRRVAPHIPTCLKNLYSTHEDVEVGRCVQKFAGIPCTWNYEVNSNLLRIKLKVFNDKMWKFLSRCSQFYIIIRVVRMHSLAI